MALIHEALHFAGLTGCPCHPRGKTSGEINCTVMTACDPR